MEKEEWATYPLNDRYSVSTLGRIKADGVLRKLTKRRGYLVTSVRIKGEAKSVLVHRMVAQTFIPNPESKRVVNHINGKKNDNRLANLEWATDAENVNHAWRTGLCDGTRHEGKWTIERDAETAKQMYELFINFYPRESLARRFNLKSKACVYSYLKKYGYSTDPNHWLKSQT